MRYTRSLIWKCLIKLLQYDPSSNVFNLSEVLRNASGVYKTDKESQWFVFQSILDFTVIAHQNTQLPNITVVMFFLQGSFIIYYNFCHFCR